MNLSTKNLIRGMFLMAGALSPVYGQGVNQAGSFSALMRKAADRDSKGFKTSFDPRRRKVADSGDPVEIEDPVQSAEESELPQQAADDSPQELAKQLSNPVASLISVPFQFNFDRNLGPNGDGNRMTLNIQPVIPFTLGRWGLVTRTILPIIHQTDVTGPNTSETGLGDITQSFFISRRGLFPFVLSAGPVFLIPTGTSYLGSRQFGIGATAVALKQQGGWTYGLLYNHIWGVAGSSSRPKINSDFFQPFISYRTKTAWTFSLNTESIYDWNSSQWSVPIHTTISKLFKIGKQPISIQAGSRCWTASPPNGPHGCAPRIAVTLLFPAKH